MPGLRFLWVPQPWSAYAHDRRWVIPWLGCQAVFLFGTGADEWIGQARGIDRAVA